MITIQLDEDEALFLTKALQTLQLSGTPESLRRALQIIDHIMVQLDQALDPEPPAEGPGR